MARYPFARVPQDPPYITRSRPDNALVNVADDGSQILFILGQGRARGASRTVKNFIRQIPQSRFRGDKDRFPVLLDFCDSGNSVCDPVEILVKIRN